MSLSGESAARSGTQAKELLNRILSHDLDSKVKKT